MLLLHSNKAARDMLADAFALLHRRIGWLVI